MSALTSTRSSRTTSESEKSSLLLALAMVEGWLLACLIPCTREARDRHGPVVWLVTLLCLARERGEERLAGCWRARGSQFIGRPGDQQPGRRGWRGFRATHTRTVGRHACCVHARHELAERAYARRWRGSVRCCCFISLITERCDSAAKPTEPSHSAIVRYLRAIVIVATLDQARVMSTLTIRVYGVAIKLRSAGLDREFHDTVAKINTSIFL